LPDVIGGKLSGSAGEKQRLYGERQMVPDYGMIGTGGKENFEFYG